MKDLCDYKNLYQANHFGNSPGPDALGTQVIEMYCSLILTGHLTSNKPEITALHAKTDILCKHGKTKDQTVQEPILQEA